MKRLWPFGKKEPESPGFGLSKGYYLSVLSAKAQLPRPVELANPDGVGGAVAGLIAPLTSGEGKEALQEPMHRGMYAISSPDKRTVLRCTVVPKEEAGFDPESLLQTKLGARIPDDIASRIRATWSLIQLTFESYDPAVYPAVELLLSLAERAGELTGGAVADPVSQVYKLPGQVRNPPPAGAQIHAADVVQTHFRAVGDRWHVYTLGLSKFHLAELEFGELPESIVENGMKMLLGLSQSILMGNVVKPGDRMGAAGAPLQAAEGGLDRAIWEGIPALELIPAGKGTVEDCIRLWAQESGI